MSKLSSYLIQKFQLLKAGVALNYASDMQKRIPFSFFEKCNQVVLCRLCHTAIANTRIHSFTQFSLIFVLDIVSA